jgi:hypothetical protein
MKKTLLLFIGCVIALWGLYNYSFSKGYNQCKGDNAISVNEKIRESEKLIYKLKTENKELKDELKTKDNQDFFNIPIPSSLQLCIKERNCK